MSNFIKLMSSDESIDLSILSVDDLYKLHFTEESFIANKAKKMPPFSIERNKFLQAGYEIVLAIMAEARSRKRQKNKNNGVTDYSVAVLLDLIGKKLESQEQITLYEAGVGSGYALKTVMSKMGRRPDEVFIKGCDMALSEEINELKKQYPEMGIYEGHIYDHIHSLPDDCIDIFYADNVFEHFLPDEANQIYAEISKKMKHGGFVYLIIPNRYTGPHDISRKFLPMGSKAAGFHFMEATFNEITQRMAGYSVHHMLCAFKMPKYKIICIRCGFWINLKLQIEKYLAKIPAPFLKKLLFATGGYNIYIMKKE